MTLIPDVPVVIVVVHLFALALFFARTLVSNRRRLALLREHDVNLADTL